MYVRKKKRRPCLINNINTLINNSIDITLIWIQVVTNDREITYYTENLSNDLH